MARKIIYILLTVLAGGVGAYLAAGYGRDDRAQWWQRAHLAVIQNQLADLKAHLDDYKKAHGRYPTTDEGLAALDNFEARFPVRVRPNPHGDADEFAGFQLGERTFWSRGKSTVTAFRRQFKRVPKTGDELLEVLFGPGARQAGKDEPGTVQLDVAIGKEGNVFVLSPAGVLSPWMVPYVYENRTGHDPAVFESSPVARDTKGRFSVRVAPDVYLSSVGGERAAQRLDELWWRDARIRLAGVGLLVVALVLLILLVAARAAVAGVLALLGAGAAGFAAHSLSQMSCYIMGPLFGSRDPQLVVRRKELLDKYRAAGVINEATYKKSLAAMERAAKDEPDATSKPAATAPSEPR